MTQAMDYGSCPLCGGNMIGDGFRTDNIRITYMATREQLVTGWKYHATHPEIARESREFYYHYDQHIVRIAAAIISSHTNFMNQNQVATSDVIDAAAELAAEIYCRTGPQ